MDKGPVNRNPAMMALGVLVIALVAFVLTYGIAYTRGLAHGKVILQEQSNAD